MIDAADALEAVRRFRAGRRLTPMDETRSVVRRAVVAGRDAWVVVAVEALSKEEPAWLSERIDGGPVPHFVDTQTGAVFGYDAQTPVFFDAVDRVAHEKQVLNKRLNASLARAVLRRWMGL